MQNYFLVKGFNNRITLTFKPNEITVYPNYLSSFSKKKTSSLVLFNSEFGMSNTSIYDKSDCLQINVLLSAVIYNN